MGGRLTQMIRLTRPWLGHEEEAAVASVLASGMLVQGARVAELEAAIAARTGRRHAIAVSNGTSALMLALQALGIGKGDRVLCPNLTWPSPAHAILDVGAEPILVEVDLREWNAGPEAMAAACEANGPIAAAIAIDQFGNPARVDEIAQALERVAGKPVPVIADAACSLGSTLHGKPCGSFGVIACTSFHPRKVITTGEGGMCLTDDDVLAGRLRELRNHGQAAPGTFARASGNHRLSEIAAAIGIEQMKRLDAIVHARQTLAARYRKAFEPLGLALQEPPEHASANVQTLGVLLPDDVHASTRARLSSANDRDRVIAALEQKGVQASALSYALHTLPQLRSLPQLANADALEGFASSLAIVARGVALPLYPQMTVSEQDEVIAAVQAVLG